MAPSVSATFATTRGLRGLARSASSAPHRAPTVPPCTIVPQASSPPRLVTAITGPIVIRAQRLRFHREWPTRFVQYHRWRRSCAQPSASCLTNRSRGAGGIGASRSRPSSTALAVNVAASRSSAQPGPAVSARAVAIPGPSSMDPRWAIAMRALARGRCSATTVAGTRPVVAGRKNAEPAPETAASAARWTMSTVPVISSRPMAAWASPRTTSAPIITRRRGSRSAHTPPGSISATVAIDWAARTTPRSVAEPVAVTIASARATTVTESPTCERVWPVHSRRKRGSRRGAHESRNGVMNGNLLRKHNICICIKSGATSTTTRRSAALPFGHARA